MRIIAGEFRGRRLLQPEETGTTRPVTDRVKQSLFDILAPVIEGAIVYDLFAGTGSMGLESLSRGAAHATFFEADRSAVTRLRRNVEALKLHGRSTVIPGDLFRHLGSTDAKAPATLVFLDPPYRFLRERAEDLRKLARDLAERHLAPDGLVIFRHATDDALDLQPLAPLDARDYGSMTIHLLRAAS